MTKEECHNIASKLREVVKKTYELEGGENCSAFEGLIGHAPLFFNPSPGCPIIRGLFYLPDYFSTSRQGARLLEGARLIKGARLLEGIRYLGTILRYYTFCISDLSRMSRSLNLST